MRILLLILTLTAISCGQRQGFTLKPRIDIPEPDGLVVIGRSSLKVDIGESRYAQFLNSLQNAFLASAYANPGTHPVSVVLAPNTTMVLSSEDFEIPTLTNDILSFGSLKLTALSTNDLKKCPNNPGKKCKKAIIRIYTSGVDGAGFYNTEDGYGVPLLAASAVPEAEVGLGVENSYSVHEIDILPNMRTIHLSDFDPAPVINIKGDFTNAGAGTYSTTINVEFALAH